MSDTPKDRDIDPAAPPTFRAALGHAAKAAGMEAIDEARANQWRDRFGVLLDQADRAPVGEPRRTYIELAAAELAVGFVDAAAQARRLYDACHHWGEKPPVALAGIERKIAAIAKADMPAPDDDPAPAPAKGARK
jgi:hypothetical protein